MEKIKRPKNIQLNSAINQHRLAVALKFTIIAATIIVFYLQDLNLILSSSLTNESMFHILAVPFLFAYMLYRKRAIIKATLTSQSGEPNFWAKNLALFSGVLICAVSILIYWFGSYTFTPVEYHMATLPFFTAGLILILFNDQTLKQMAFPILFLIFLTPPPTEILYNIGSILSDISAHASNGIVNLVGITSTITTQYGNPMITLTRPDNTIMNFSVDIACSGVYSLIGFTLFAIFIAYITRGKLINKLALLIMGIPLIVALNIIRITIILIIGYNYGDALALQIFHAAGATVLMFIGTLILLAISEKIFKKPKPPQTCPNCTTQTPLKSEISCPTCGKIFKYPQIKLTRTDLIKIAAIILTVAAFFSIQAPVFALTEGPAEILVQTPTGIEPNQQNLPLPQISGFNLRFIYRDKAFEEATNQDAALAFTYSSNDPNKPTVWVSIEIAQTTGSLHRWETCLVNYPLSRGLKPSVTQLELRDVQVLENPPIMGRYFAFQRNTNNQTQVVLYWYETTTIEINGTAQQKQVKMSLIAYPQSPQDIAKAKEALLPIAKAINEYWEPIKTWTTVALAISQNGLTLAALPAALLIALVIYKGYLNSQELTALKRLYSKLPAQTQQLITAIENAQTNNNPTQHGIATEYEKLTQTKPDPQWLNQKLQETQKTGLIKQKLINQNDQPKTAYRTQMSTSQNPLTKIIHILSLN